MDGSRFDALTKQLAHATSRRSLVKTGAAAMTAALGLGTASTRSKAFICRTPGVLCGKDAHCCSDICDPASHRCICPVGETACGPDCVDTNTDVTNCGACGNVCPTPDNASPTCDGGSCGFTCNSGFADCNGVANDGCEINTTNDVNNCGSCGNGCSAPENGTASCSDSTCSYACNEGFKPCGDACIPEDGCCTDDDCDDSNLCTTDACDLETHQCRHTAITCPSGGPCKDSSGCDPDTGCTYVNKDDGTACSTGSKCTLGQTCSGGVCQGGHENPCDNPGPCFDECGYYPPGHYFCGYCYEQQLGDGCIYPPKPQGASCGEGHKCDGYGNCAQCIPDGQEIVCNCSCTDVIGLCCSNVCHMDNGLNGYQPHCG